ncbi:hypothetical protein FC17_GL001056 [Secundilactobacillus paracollinoides DSM 15502 = JCM 11969]|nr:hypothetical protein FC17_GL001056 [Secundilactobacillus paracollinoides DSM 15502 = JCM 11969]
MAAVVLTGSLGCAVVAVTPLQTILIILKILRMNVFPSVFYVINHNMKFLKINRFIHFILI